MINMKTIFINFIFILFLYSCSAQQTVLEQQKQAFECGIEFLRNQNLNASHNAFYHSYIINEDDELGKKAKIKADSLKIILRKELLSKIKGVWIARDNEKSVKNLLIIEYDKLMIYNTLNHKIIVEKFIFLIISTFFH